MPGTTTGIAINVNGIDVTQLNGRLTTPSRRPLFKGFFFDKTASDVGMPRPKHTMRITLVLWPLIGFVAAAMVPVIEIFVWVSLSSL